MIYTIPSAADYKLYDDVTVIRWKDGDTVVVRIRVAYDFGFYRRGTDEFEVTLRVKFLDAPELKESKGPAALAAAQELAPIGSRIKIRTFKDEKSFERFVAEITLTDGRDFATVMKMRGQVK